MLLTAANEVVDSALITNRAHSLGHLFRERAAASADREAFRFFRDGEWRSVTWRQTEELAHRYAAGLIALGIAPEDRVAIASTTRFEWVVADLAIMCAGAATTTVYPTSSVDDVAFIVADSGSRIVMAENDVQVAKLKAKRDELPAVTKVVVMDGAGDGDWVISTDELGELGAAHLAEHPQAVDERIDGLAPDKLATIIYTSGTTGRPKGALLTHDCWVYEGAAVDSVHILSEDDLQYLWLPLSHSFGKVLLTLAVQIGFPTAVDGRIDVIVDNLAVIKPTFMGAAPRIFEKAYGRVTMMVAEEGGVKEKLFGWAFGVGRQVSDLRLQGKSPSGLLAIQHAIADKLVLSKVRDRFGGRVRFFISGSAALNRDVAEWFGAAGMVIIEGYGLTESSAASVVNRPAGGSYQYGSVGLPLPGTEVVIAEDGEVLMRGPGIMRGYHNREEATAEALQNGWLHTGDIGEIDDRGFVRITDRKKDLFKTSGGKYIAPSQIESIFKGLCPYVSQMLVAGDGRNYATALITLDAEAMTGWAAQHGLAGRPYHEVVTSSACQEMVQGYVDQLNLQLNRWETIKKFTILDEDLTIDAGMLTPSLKLRRRAVVDKYGHHIESMYS
jgi:long-chain acyl-CoA synthetase